uniref:Uncharacterized protein n=1 Tax=Picea glauca TaxID=3330 RepID=A0A101M3V5_PICGL|nr:hypothetical protein ABT39_MTgene302 [Picea glauca]QHR90701.1 hypothetical protein Q903MT_gene4727 [Picea sitchensis]
MTEERTMGNLQILPSLLGQYRSVRPLDRPTPEDVCCFHPLDCPTPEDVFHQVNQSPHSLYAPLCRCVWWPALPMCAVSVRCSAPHRICNQFAQSMPLPEDVSSAARTHAEYVSSTHPRPPPVCPIGPPCSQKPFSLDQ